MKSIGKKDSPFTHDIRKHNGYVVTWYQAANGMYIAEATDPEGNISARTSKHPQDISQFISDIEKRSE